MYSVWSGARWRHTKTIFLEFFPLFSFFSEYRNVHVSMASSEWHSISTCQAVRGHLQPRQIGWKGYRVTDLQCVRIELSDGSKHVTSPGVERLHRWVIRIESCRNECQGETDVQSPNPRTWEGGGGLEGQLQRGKATGTWGQQGDSELKCFLKCIKSNSAPTKEISV